MESNLNKTMNTVSYLRPIRDDEKDIPVKVQNWTSETMTKSGLKG